jgi:hypothetical protein
MSNTQQKAARAIELMTEQRQYIAEALADHRGNLNWRERAQLTARDAMLVEELAALKQAAEIDAA